MLHQDTPISCIYNLQLMYEMTTDTLDELKKRLRIFQTCRWRSMTRARTVVASSNWNDLTVGSEAS